MQNERVIRPTILECLFERAFRGQLPEPKCANPAALAPSLALDVEAAPLITLDRRSPERHLGLRYRCIVCVEHEPENCARTGRSVHQHEFNPVTRGRQQRESRVRVPFGARYQERLGHEPRAIETESTNIVASRLDEGQEDVHRLSTDIARLHERAIERDLDVRAGERRPAFIEHDTGVATDRRSDDDRNGDWRRAFELRQYYADVRVRANV